MRENLHDIDDLFRASVEQHEEMPGTGVWEGIDKNLDKDSISAIQRKYGRLKRIAIVLLILLLGTLVYEMQSKQPEKDSVGSNITKTKNALTTSSTVPKKENTITNTQSANPVTGTIITTPDKTPGNNNKTGDNKNSTLVGSSNSDLDKPGSTDKKENDNLTVPARSLQKNTSLAAKGKSLLKLGSPEKLKIGINSPSPVSDDSTEDKNIANTIPGHSNLLYSLLRLYGINIEKISPHINKIQSGELVLKNKKPSAEIVSNPIVGRSVSSKKGKSFHFSASLFFAPMFSFDRIQDDHKDGRPNGPNGPNGIKDNEQKQHTYSFGLSVEVPFAKRWGLQSGLTYLNKTTDIAPQKIYAKLDNDGKVKYQFNCSSGSSYITPKNGPPPAVGDSINISASTTQLKYLAVPLAIRYSFTIGKFNISPTIGSSVNILVKQKAVTGLANGNSFDKQTINNIKGLKQTYFNGFVGVGLDYNINKKIAVNITPASNFALTSINKNSPVKSYPNTVGVAAGVKIKL
jgi:hypothetical protein